MWNTAAGWRHLLFDCHSASLNQDSAAYWTISDVEVEERALYTLSYEKYSVGCFFAWTARTVTDWYFSLLEIVLSTINFCLDLFSLEKGLTLWPNPLRGLRNPLRKQNPFRIFPLAFWRVRLFVRKELLSCFCHTAWSMYWTRVGVLMLSFTMQLAASDWNQK